jgi:hypothetical protein
MCFWADMRILHMRRTLFLLLSASLLSLACNPIRTVQSVVPGLKSESSAEVGEKLKLQIPPEEAIKVLDEVAAQNGWYLVSVGDQHDMQGRRGKYFRLETDRFIGGRKQMAGVFFSDAAGSYVIIGKYDTGLPQELVPAFTAAVQQQNGASTTE